MREAALSPERRMTGGVDEVKPHPHALRTQVPGVWPTGGGCSPTGCQTAQGEGGLSREALVREAADTDCQRHSAMAGIGTDDADDRRGLRCGCDTAGSQIVAARLQQFLQISRRPPGELENRSVEYSPIELSAFRLFFFLGTFLARACSMLLLRP